MKAIAFKVEDWIAKFIKHCEKNLKIINIEINYEINTPFFKSKSELMRHIFMTGLKNDKILLKMMEDFKELYKKS